MSDVKVRVEVHEPNRLKFEKKRGGQKPYPTCKGCGSRLTDPESIARGWGRECYNNQVLGIIILEIPAGNDVIPE